MDYGGGKVHIINFSQSTEVFHIIPRLPQEFPVVILRVLNPNQNQDAHQQRLKDFEVNVNRVKVWMQYLCQHTNRWYRNVV